MPVKTKVWVTEMSYAEAHKICRNLHPLSYMRDFNRPGGQRGFSRYAGDVEKYCAARIVWSIQSTPPRFKSKFPMSSWWGNKRKVAIPFWRWV
jgi:hypothetical protein